MKRWMIYLVLAGLLVAVGLVATTQLVNAQDPTPTVPGSGFGYGRGMMGGMMGGQYAGQGVMHTYMQAALAAKLDMSVEAYGEAVAEGKTFWVLAEEKGYSVEEAQQLMVDARTEALDAAVADGVLTQEQADLMKEHMSGMTPGGCHGRGNGGAGNGTRGNGGGMRGGGRY